MRVFFGIPKFVPAHGSQLSQLSRQDCYETGETLEQYLHRIGSTGRKSIVASLQAEYLEKLPEANLQDSQVKTETAVIDRLVFPTLEEGKLPTADELQRQVSDLDNTTIDGLDVSKLDGLENLLVRLVQHAYIRGVHFF